VLFNFVLTTNCPKDVLIVSRSGDTKSAEAEYCAHAGVYYCDEQIAASATKSLPVLVRFVSRKVEDRIVIYGSEPSHLSASARPTPLSNAIVIVAFDTTTIESDNATLDLEKGVVVARGHVSITHNNEQLSSWAECVTIAISDAATRRPCD
jgi:hypothetical protein